MKIIEAPFSPYCPLHQTPINNVDGSINSLAPLDKIS